MSNSFYLTLTTNNRYGPYAYSSSNFTTYFETPLEFDESFEVALVEMIYDDKRKNNLGKIKFFKNENYLFTYDLCVYSFESIEQYLERINLDIKLELEKFDIKYKNVPKFGIKNHRLEFYHVDFNIELFGKIEELFKCDKYICISSILSYMDLNINDIFIINGYNRATKIWFNIQITPSYYY